MGSGFFLEAIGGATIGCVGGAIGGGLSGGAAGYALEECTGTIDRDYILRGAKYGAMGGGYAGIMFGSKWATEYYCARRDALDLALAGKTDL